MNPVFQRAPRTSQGPPCAGPRRSSAGGEDSTGLAKRYPVCGTVTYNGVPLAKGNVNFIPAGTSETDRAATAAIEDGRYTLTTATENDGAFPGSYDVTITSTEADLTKVKANMKGVRVTRTTS